MIYSVDEAVGNAHKMLVEYIMVTCLEGNFIILEKLHIHLLLIPAISLLGI